MSIIALVTAVLAGVTAHASVYHLLLNVRRGENSRRDRLFALTGFALVLYDAFSIGLYASTSVEEGREWQRLQLATIATAGLGFVYFVAEFATGRVLARLKRFAFVFPVLGAIGLVERRGWLLTSEPKIVRFELPVLGEIVYHEAAAGPLQVVLGLSSLFVAGYVLAVARELYAAGRKKRAQTLMLGSGLFAVAMLNDGLVSLGFIDAPYLMELAWTAVVVVMGYSFSEEVLEGARAKEELADARMRLAHADRLESIGKLAGNVAHDLNNMLTPVLGYAELVRRGLPEDARARAQLDHLVGAAQRAAALTRKLLALGRKQVLEVEPLDVGANVRELVPLLEHLLPPNVRLTLEVDEALPLVDADGPQLEQVWMNLVANARDAMPSGGEVRIAVRRATEGAREGVRVVVADSGFGMSPETIAHVFEPFYTTKKAGEGTGLGLPIVRGIVEQHGGRVDVESAKGEGTSFGIFLPATTRPPLSMAPPPARSPEGHGRPAVIVVDDDAAVRAFVAEVLSGHGYEVEVAGSARELEDLLGRRDLRVDLLVTDVRLPDTDGRRIRAMVAERLPGVRCLFMTGHADDVLAPRGMLRPSVDLLRKPFTADALLEKVRAALAVPAAARGDGPTVETPP